jgi:hypothetical protein
MHFACILLLSLRQPSSKIPASQAETPDLETTGENYNIPASSIACFYLQYRISKKSYMAIL